MSNLLLPPSILFMTSNHQTTNIVLPKFFYEFFSVCAFEKERKLFIGLKPRKNLFWTNKKFVFLFNCSSWEKFVEKIGGNKIGGLMSRTFWRKIAHLNFLLNFDKIVHLWCSTSTLSTNLRIANFNFWSREFRTNKIELVILHSFEWCKISRSWN